MNLKGIDKVFRGILHYRHKYKEETLKQLNQASANPSPSAVFVTCVDSRLQPSKFTQVTPGDMFIARNVGNLVPHYDKYDFKSPSPEPAVLELGVAVQKIRHVVICGHSDCKAMSVLHSVKDLKESQALAGSPIKAWLSKHANASLHRFQELEKQDFKKPLMVGSQSVMSEFPAFIDVENKFSITDKLSQVNTLLQMENIASYPFMVEAIKNGDTMVHAMWFDIFSGEIQYFSKKQKHFLPITENNVDILLEELNETNGPNLTNKEAQEMVDNAKESQKDQSAKKCC